MLDFYFFGAFLNLIADWLNSYTFKSHFIIVNLPQLSAAENHNFWLELATIITPFATIAAALIALWAAIYTSNKSYKGNLSLAQKSYEHNRQLEWDRQLMHIKNEVYTQAIDSFDIIYDINNVQDLKKAYRAFHSSRGKLRVWGTEAIYKLYRELSLSLADLLTDLNLKHTYSSAEVDAKYNLIRSEVASLHKLIQEDLGISKP